VLSELVGGKLAIRLAPVLGGCGNDAIDTARRGTKFLASVSTGNEGVEGRCNDPETFRGVCGRREAFRRFWVDARLEREFGKAGRADVGGWDALKDARGGRGNVVVVVVVIGGYSPANEMFPSLRREDVNGR